MRTYNLTPEGRRRLEETIRKNKPWLKSTGPRTWKGKRISRGNAWKHGARTDACLPGEIRAFIAGVTKAEMTGAEMADELLAASAEYFTRTNRIEGLTRWSFLAERYFKAITQAKC